MLSTVKDRPKFCPTCHQTTGETEPCGGTLRVIDTSDLAPQFAPYLNTNTRIRVDSDGFVRTGTVGKTTGWKPAYLLMHRSSDHGSWDVLGPNDRIVAVKVGSTYRSI